VVPLPWLLPVLEELGFGERQKKERKKERKKGLRIVNHHRFGGAFEE
jgi:hypothetical protein